MGGGADRGGGGAVPGRGQERGAALAILRRHGARPPARAHRDLLRGLQQALGLPGRAVDDVVQLGGPVRVHARPGPALPHAVQLRHVQPARAQPRAVQTGEQVEHLDPLL